MRQANFRKVVRNMKMTSADEALLVMELAIWICSSLAWHELEVLVLESQHLAARLDRASWREDWKVVTWKSGKFVRLSPVST